MPSPLFSVRLKEQGRNARQTYISEVQGNRRGPFEFPVFFTVPQTSFSGIDNVEVTKYRDRVMSHAVEGTVRLARPAGRDARLSTKISACVSGSLVGANLR